MLNRKLAALTLVPAALFVSAPAHAASGDSIKVWVCKYVHAPGAETEVLKPGKQPIAANSAATVGTSFKDGQVRSVVVDVVTAENTSRPGHDYTGPVTCADLPGEGPGDGPGDGSGEEPTLN